MPPRILLVSPALADANNGNWHTAARWQAFLSPHARVDVARDWVPGRDDDVDALVALHARRSGDAVLRFAAAHPARGCAVVLTGTDLYRDLPGGDVLAAHALECASHLVVLQPQALQALPAGVRAKARVIVQSAPAWPSTAPPAPPTRFVAVGHLRAEKDPLTLLAAVQRLAPAAAFVLEHVGGALDAALGQAAQRCAQACPAYRWLGALPADAARARIAAAHALVHPSRMEGGANVVIEALRSSVPVLASRIDGNVGLLGEGYGGYFPAGDAPALAGLMRRFAHDAGFADALRAEAAALAPRYAPEVEAAAVEALGRDLLAPGVRA